MHIELVDCLRCPQPHADSWLVAAVTRFDGRDIVDGELGCPICRRRYPVREGEADFTDRESSASDGAESPVATTDGEAPRTPDELLLRARALLDLREEGGIVLLGGTRGAVALMLEEIPVMTLLLNRSPGAAPPGRYPSALRTATAPSIAPGALRGAWLDASTASDATVVAVARALRVGGRLLAPASTPVPPGLRVLARDAQEWVAESDGRTSAPITLKRR